MVCSNCGGAVEMTNAPTETSMGKEFTEEYECVHCGATGRISGTVGQPVARWNKTGRVFGGA